MGDINNINVKAISKQALEKDLRRAAPGGDRRALLSWCLYDWANSAFAAVIITFVYSLYFARVVVGDETQGNILWNYAIAGSAFVVAILSPVLGAVADHYGRRKRFLLVFTLLCVLATALLWFGAPGKIVTVLVLIFIANLGYELGFVFYNAMLPHIARPDMIGRLSGWAWGIGYIGGLSCLATALLGLVGVGPLPPLLALPSENYENIRAAGPLVALWITVFCLPLLLFTPDGGKTGLPMGGAVTRGLAQLKQTFKTVRHQGNLLRFLIASALYRDGLNTLFSAGAIFAGSTLGLSFEQVLLFGIGLNITAGVGAAVFGYLDDYAGSRNTALVALAGLVVTGTLILFVTDPVLFTVIALAMGLFIGPAQSAGRTLAARLAPEGMVTQTYGLYALTGKSVAFLGPLCFALAASFFDSQRAGMATIVLFWLAGMALLATVKEKRA